MANIEENNWIKVTDKLPPTYKSVLCYCRDCHNSHFYRVAHIDSDDYWGSYDFAPLDVIAWRKIPKFEDESIEVKL